MLTFALLLAASGFLYEDPAADRQIRETLRATYDLQGNAARRSARQLQESHPLHPAGYVLEAETYWWEALADPGNGAIEQAYYSAQKMAVSKAEAALLKGDYPRTELLANLGSAYGSYARFQVTQKGAYFSALRAGLKAHSYAAQVHRLDSSYYDVYVGLGAYNYFTGTLPGVIRPFAYLIGVRGNREIGLEQLRLAVEKGRYARTEAQIVHYTILLQEKRYAEAFSLLRSLMTQFPDNQVLLTWAAEWFTRQDQQRQGADYFERLAQEQTHRSSVMEKYALLEKARFQSALRQKDAARDTLERLRKIPGHDNYLPKRVAALEKTLSER